MSFYAQWGTLGVLAVVGAGLYGLILVVNRAMSPSLPTPGKLSTYECGVEGVGTGWAQTSIRYYVFAFLFVIFDVESIFIFPWAVILGGLDAETTVPAVFALGEMFVFIAILAVGLVYAWRKKVLVWD